MTASTVAAALAAWIQREAGGVAFLVAGAQIDAVVTACADADVQLVPTASEFGAAAAADARARVTGGVGVCLTIGGPGLSGAAAALNVARAHDSRVVAFSGDVPTWLSGRGGFQDAAGDGAVGTATLGASRRIGAAADLGPVLAWLDERAGARRASHVIVPWDVQRATRPSGPGTDTDTDTSGATRPAVARPSAAAIASRARRLADRPVLVLAERPCHADEPSLSDFVAAGGRIVLTVDALGALDRAVTAGVVDPAGRGGLVDALATGPADLVVQVGGRLGERSLGIAPDALAERCRLVHVAGHPDGPCTAIADVCTEGLDGTTWPERIDGRRGQDLPVPGSEPPRGEADGVVGAIESVVPAGSVLVVDAGRARSAVARRWRGDGRGQVLSATEGGPMGWSLGAAVGAASAAQGPVVVLLGDGSALLAAGELRAVAATGADIRVVLLADGGYSTVRTRLPGRVAHDVTSLPGEVDWVALGRSVGLAARRVAPSSLGAAVAQAGPSLTVVDLPVDGDAAGHGWRGGGA